ncbi:hypothetical protein [Paenibacillus sp. LK1]|uniref:hypothetical protein n=1 Tax=Paenibacillus sp. LK1 TaxID=2053014 RepID=UPI000F747745|nr:hypothetical protein [Paenibacillus sp. LK1]
MFLRYFGHFGTFASLIGLVFTIKPEGKLTTPGIVVLMCLCFLSLVLAIYEEIKLYKSKKGKVYSSKESVRNYMYKWISQEGVTFIFSRDLSWVSDEEMKNLFRNKARSRELKLCVSESIPFVSELAELGAEIHTYKQLDYTLKTRFTFVRVGRLDSKVAIGRDVNGNHYIEEFKATDEPVFSIASDLMEVLSRSNRLFKGEDKGESKTGNSEIKRAVSSRMGQYSSH